MKVEFVEMRHKGQKVQITDAIRRHVGYLQIFPYTPPQGRRSIGASGTQVVVGDDASVVMRQHKQPATGKYGSRKEFFQRFEQLLEALQQTINPPLILRLGVR